MKKQMQVEEQVRLLRRKGFSQQALDAMQLVLSGGGGAWRQQAWKEWHQRAEAAKAASREHEREFWRQDREMSRDMAALVREMIPGFRILKDGLSYADMENGKVTFLNWVHRQAEAIAVLVKGPQVRSAGYEGSPRGERGPWEGARAQAVLSGKKGRLGDACIGQCRPSDLDSLSCCLPSPAGL